MTERWPNIVLTGFMGTGKTTVGRALAAKLCYEYVETDGLIEERHGSIPDIFATEGEAAFRQYEQEVARELAGRDGCVISTGGRLMLEPANAEPLAKSGYVFCLTASVNTIVKRVTRIADPTHRPLLNCDDPRRKIADLLAERADGYAQFDQISTDGRPPGQIADEIISRLAPEGGASRCG